MFRWGIAATAHQAAEPLTFSGSGVRKMITKLQHKKRPLPLGEGWGEGLASANQSCILFSFFSKLRTLTLALSQRERESRATAFCWRTVHGALFVRRREHSLRANQQFHLPGPPDGRRHGGEWKL